MAENLLAKRILDQGGGATVQEYSERSLLAHLKQQFGNTYTNKMEGMFSDYAQAHELQDQFNDFLRRTPNNLNFDMEVLILTMSHWPHTKQMNFHIPPSLSLATDLYNKFYEQTYKERKIQFIYEFGSSVMSLKIGEKSFDATMTTPQAIVLEHFNGGKTTLQNLTVAVNLSQDELKPILASFMTAKLPVIVYVSDENKEKDCSTIEQIADHISPTDEICLNPQFVSRRARFALPHPPVLTQSTIDKNTGSVMEERKTQLDAAIVRLMKSKRTMKYQDLITEVMSQRFLFVPTPRDIKTRIEDLILRQFIERDASDRTTVVYVP